MAQGDASSPEKGIVPNGRSREASPSLRQRRGRTSRQSRVVGVYGGVVAKVVASPEKGIVSNGRSREVRPNRRQRRNSAVVAQLPAAPTRSCNAADTDISLLDLSRSTVDAYVAILNFSRFTVDANICCLGHASPHSYTKYSSPVGNGEVPAVRSVVLLVALT